jgi:hypothetical protein
VPAIQIGGDFSVEQLHAALARVRECHPLAAVRVAVDEAEGPCFVSEGVPAFLVRVLTGCGDADWVAAVREELGEPFALDRGPLVRFVLLRGPDFSDLVAVCHHGICDGMAGAYLLRDIKRELNRGSTHGRIFLWLLGMQSMVSALSDADMLSVLAEFTSQPIGYDFSITNLGRSISRCAMGRCGWRPCTGRW